MVSVPRQIGLALDHHGALLTEVAGDRLYVCIISAVVNLPRDELVDITRENWESTIPRPPRCMCIMQ
jgi:hypothetical protein